jgi:hypothetical protein
VPETRKTEKNITYETYLEVNNEDVANLLTNCMELSTTQGGHQL